MVPCLKMWAGRSRHDLTRDLLAGGTTAVMLIPQGMAYAMLAGLDPITGLYASTLPTAIYALLGTSRALAVGPVAMISLLVAGGVAPLAGADPVLYAAYASILMLMVGVMQLAMGMFRLGFLVKYLSHPVIAGFTSAAALIIGFSQLKHLLGVKIPRSHHVHEILGHALGQLHAIHGVTVAISLGSILALVTLKRFAPRFPRFLAVVAAATIAVWALGLSSGGVAIVGTVPQGLPALTIPAVDLSALRALLPIAITISLIAFMESIAVARAFARKGGYEVDANQELRALGAANLIGAFFQGYPITGGFSRTAVNEQAGAQTTLAGLITALLIAFSLLFLTPLFFYLPRAVLAAIIMTAVFGLIDHHEARHLWAVSRPDFWLMILTFGATLLWGIEPGILVGVGASLLWFVIAHAKPHVAVLGRVPGTQIYRNLERFPDAERTPGVAALRLDAPLFFANTAFLRETVESLLCEDTHTVILDAGAISSVDASGADALLELAASLQTRGVGLWLATVRGPVRDALDSIGLSEYVPLERRVERVHDAFTQASP